jgi:putative MATE family efflux protein
MKDMTDGGEAGLILSFTVPMLIGNVFQQLYNVIDSIIVGRAIGKYALGAVGASFPILFLLIALFIGVTLGFSTVVSQYYGAKDMERVRRTVDTTIVFTLLSSIVFTVAGLYLSEPILALLKTPAQILPQAAVFLRIMFGGMFFFIGYNAVSSILWGLGDSRTPLYFLAFSTVINVLLALVFVLVFKWGIAGSAWATVIAQAVSFIMCVIYLRSHKLLQFRLTRLAFDWEILKKSLTIGLPTGFQQVFIAVGMMALTRIVNGFGTDAIAAFTAAMRIDTFAVMPALSVSAAMSAFVGQNIGAGKMGRVRHGLRAGLTISAAISIATAMAVIIFGRWMISLFNSDPEVILIGSHYVFIVGGFYIIFSSMVVINGALRGAGDTFIPMFVSIASLWLIRVPISVWLSRLMGTDGIWWGVPIAWGVGLSLTVGYYLSGRWKKKAILQESSACLPGIDKGPADLPTPTI